MNNGQILISDDDKTLCYLLKEELVSEGYFVDITFDGKYAIDNIKKKSYDLVLLDLEMTEVHGEEVLKFVRDYSPSTKVIILTGKTDIRSAINCIKNGAYDFLPKPYEFGQLIVVIQRALEHKRLLMNNEILSSKINRKVPNIIIGESKSIRDIISLADRAAKSDSNILLEGETGTGKELFAEFIHKSSNRSDKPFVAVNCASLPDQLIESELFGYEKGAFTDAKTSKQGLVEMANGGTLFLDEIGEMSLSLQPKLLRFLENGEFRRVGGINNMTSHVRVIGATNKNLLEEAEQKKFRRDLLFRLNVITLTIPPLRDRGSDVILLANYFLQRKSSVHNIKVLSKEAESALMQYNFPGNVRELEHTIERSLIFADKDYIEPRDLNLPAGANTRVAEGFMVDGKLLSMDEVEKIHIKKALEQNNWNRELTASLLGISQKTLYTKIKKYDLK